MPTCDSCGREDSELVAVHRVYVVPESWDTPGSEKILAEVEQLVLLLPHALPPPGGVRLSGCGGFPDRGRRTS